MAATEGDTELAAIEFGRAAHAAPEESDIVVAYVEGLVAARRRDDAVAVGLRASAKWPNNSALAIATGHALRKARRPLEAVGYLERARKLAPDSDKAAVELGAALIAAGNTGRAALVYAEIAKRNPDAVKPRLRLARLLLDSGRPKRARPVIEEILELRPSHTSARLLHSRTLLELGDATAANETLSRGFVASGRSMKVVERTFLALMESGAHPRAATYALSLDSTALSPDQRAAIGELVLRAGFAARALEYATRVRASEPSSFTAALLGARSLARLRRFGEAAAAIRELPLRPQSRILAAEWLVLAGKDDVARALAADVSEDDPLHHYLSARIDELGGDVEQARRTLSVAIRRWPTNDDLKFDLASLELRHGDHARAVAIASSLLSANPDNTTLANFVGYALADAATDLTRAKKLLKRSLRRRPDDPHILDSFGWLQFQKKQFTKAATTLRRAWRLAPSEPEILFHLARVEEELGLEAAAERRYHQAYRLAAEPTLRRRINAHLVAVGSRATHAR